MALTKEAKSAYNKVWRAKNIDRIRAYDKTRYHSDPERRRDAKERSSKWQKENRVYRKEYIRSYHREYDVRKMEKKAGRNKPLVCEICGNEGKIMFDHDHKTGVFRGWICQNCNFCLGHAKDNIETLKSLIAYLEKQS